MKLAENQANLFKTLNW